MATIFRPPLAVKPWIRPTTSAVVSQQQGSPYPLLQQPFVPREFVTYRWKPSVAANLAQSQGMPFPLFYLGTFQRAIFRDPIFIKPWPPSKEAAAGAQPEGTAYPLIHAGAVPFIPPELVTYYRKQFSTAAILAQAQGSLLPPPAGPVPFVPREFVTYQFRFSQAALLAQPQGRLNPPPPVTAPPFVVPDWTRYLFYKPVPDPQPPGSWYPIFPPAPPPPPPPIDTHGVVFAVDVQDGFTVGATLYDGKPAVMIMNVDAVIPSTDLLVVFTKPDGTVVYSRSPYTYTGIVDMAALGAHFQKFEYIVYTFIPGELDQRGLWTAYLQAGVYAYPKGYFTVH